MSKNIVLIGFMGAGKTLTARHLAAKLNRTIISTDERIVAKEGKSIVDIFKDQGEQYFRDLEAKIIAEIAHEKNMIVDCGGGIALNPKNMELLKKNGIIFYLAVSAEESYKNVKIQKNRPLLNTPDPKSEIKKLLEKRRPFYEKADHAIDANSKTGGQLCDEIIALLPKDAR